MSESKLDAVRDALGIESDPTADIRQSREGQRVPVARTAAGVRRALQRSSLVPDLLAFFNGNGRSLTPLQARVGMALLNKAYPDLKAVEVDATLTTATSRMELEQRMAAAGLDIDGVWERLETSTAPAGAVQIAADGDGKISDGDGLAPHPRNFGDGD